MLTLMSQESCGGGVGGGVHGTHKGDWDHGTNDTKIWLKTKK